jgi:hypothetical protein
MKFAQGDYDQAAFSNKSCCSKFAHFLLLSVLGPLLFFFVEIIEQFKKLFLIFGICSTNCRKQIDHGFDEVKSCLTGLNGFQLNSIEKQKKMTTLMFENFPMNVLHILILFKVIDIKELNSDGN